MSVQITIKITMSNTGEIRVEGPLENKILCFGLLEVAKDTIKNYKQGGEKKIVVPELLMPPKM